MASPQRSQHRLRFGVILGSKSGIVDFECDEEQSEEDLLELFDGKAPAMASQRSPRTRFFPKAGLIMGEAQIFERLYSQRAIEAIGNLAARSAQEPFEASHARHGQGPDRLQSVKNKAGPPSPPAPDGPTGPLMLAKKSRKLPHTMLRGTDRRRSSCRRSLQMTLLSPS